METPSAAVAPAQPASNKRTAQQPPPPPPIAQASKRTKKNARGRRAGGGGNNYGNQHQQQHRSSNGNGDAAGAAANNDDLVRVVPVPPDSVLLQEDGWRPVRLSATDHAPQARVDPESGTLASTKGYCTARGTHGASAGTWYYEVELTSLGGEEEEDESGNGGEDGERRMNDEASTSSPRYLGAARVGWCTRAAELQAPVGYDRHGYALRDREGCKVHDALREPYLSLLTTSTWTTTASTATEEVERQNRNASSPPLSSIKQGDVIGCYLHLPPGGRSLERTKDDIVQWKGGLYFVDRPEAPAVPLEGSAVAFYVNGVPLGVAFADVLEGTYYPAGSLFTPPPPPSTTASKEKEKEATTTTSALGEKLPSSLSPFDAVATFNFGPRFKFPPTRPPREGLPEARPACEMAGPPP